jgi:uncharacterized protein YjiS (DUF1127 family)
MRRMLKVIGQAWLRLERAVVASRRSEARRIAEQVERRRATAVKLVELDERTLKDIGLEPWRGPLGAEVALRRQESRRLRASYYGLW